MWSLPRESPDRRLPAVAGTIVIGLALPLFVVAGWPLEAWAIALGLWVAYQVIGLLLERVPLGSGNLAAAGAVAFGRMLRAAGLVTILIVIAASDSSLGLAAAIVYALAFTVELVVSLMVHFGGEAKA
jgi:hypothetical protein